MKRATFVIAILVSMMIILPAVSGDVPQPAEKTPIKHVINIYFENHTFDNFSGIYPKDSSSTDQSLISNISEPLNLLNNSSLLKELKPVPAGTFNTSNPIEGYTAYHIDWNHGAMNGFLNGSGPSSMTYYTSAQLGPLWDLAEEYVIADNYFAPTISESAPNTLYYLAGFSPVFNDYGPPPSIPFGETIFGELNSYNISWGVYNSGDYKSFDMSNYIQGISAYSGNVHSWAVFTKQLAQGSLPSVSYVFSQGSKGYDTGAPNSILKGELWLMAIINDIERSPVWNSTVVFVTWDDPGGYFDQVPPPLVAGEQLGMRLPLIVISPFAKENYISDTILTHSSILAFIDYNWNIPPLNEFVSKVNVPLDMFDFRQERSPIIFDFGGIVSVPENLTFNLTNSEISLNLSQTFPMDPQIPFNSLSYSGHGSSNFTLSSTGISAFVSKDVAYFPFYSSPYLLFGLVVVCVLVAELIPGRKVRNAT